MRVLVAYDGSEPSRKALDRAIAMTRGTGAELTLLTVTEPVCPLGVTDQECGLMDDILRRQTEAILKSVRADLERQALKVSTEVRTGNTADEIVKMAQEGGFDTVVLGSHGRHGASRLFLGSVSNRVANHAPCSVVIVK